MNTNSDYHCPKGVVIITTDFKRQQMIVIQDTVIYPFTGSTFFVDRLILFTVPRNPGRKPEIRMERKINRTTITAFGAFRRTVALRDSAAGHRAAVFLGLLVFIKAPAAHPETSFAERMSGFIQSDVLWEASGVAISAVYINQCIDVPMFKQFVSRKIIMGRIQAEIGW